MTAYGRMRTGSYLGYVPTYYVRAYVGRRYVGVETRAIYGARAAECHYLPPMQMTATHADDRAAARTAATPPPARRSRARVSPLRRHSQVSRAAGWCRRRAAARAPGRLPHTSSTLTVAHRAHARLYILSIGKVESCESV